MRRIFNCTLPVLTAVLFCGWMIQSAPADDSQSTGSITGTVMHNGQGVSGAQVRLIELHLSTSDNQQQAKKPATGLAGKPLTTTTDTDGRFNFNDVPAETYSVFVRQEGQGIGHTRVTVVPNSNVTVSVILR